MQMEVSLSRRVEEGGRSFNFIGVYSQYLRTVLVLFTTELSERPPGDRHKLPLPTSLPLLLQR